MIKMEKEEFYKLFKIIDDINSRDILNANIGHQYCIANKIPMNRNRLYDLVKYIRLLNVLHEKLTPDDVMEVAKELKINDVYKLYLEYKEEMDKNEL